jgi:hypothetical protein
MHSSSPGRALQWRRRLYALLLPWKGPSMEEETSGESFAPVYGLSFAPVYGLSFEAT